VSPVRELALATANLHKVREIASMLADRCVEIRSLADFPGIELPPETGETFEENARVKAVSLANATGDWALADDSGLEVDALGGQPGVLSNRFAGDDASDDAKIAKVLDLLGDTPAEQRTARFRCVMALADAEGRTWTVEGICSGRIAELPRGSGGFGYDPIFLPDGQACTMAELTMEQKNRISHRGRALRAMVQVLMRLRVAESC
jgi:XTP/dITP diphosphohydrolase